VRFLPAHERRTDFDYFSESSFESDDEGSDGENDDDDNASKSLKIQQTLQALKKKLRELAAKKSKQHEGTSSTAKETAKALSKEDLKKRQEEVKQTMDAAYWRQLVVKHRNLLEAEEKVVKEQEEALARCRQEIREQERKIAKLRDESRDFQVRQTHLMKTIEMENQNVLSSRAERKDCQARIQEANQDSN